MQAQEREEIVGNMEDAHADEVEQKERVIGALQQERATLKQQTAALDDELGRWMDENDQLRNMVVKLEGRLQSQPQRDKENVMKKGEVPRSLAARCDWAAPARQPTQRERASPRQLRDPSRTGTPRGRGCWEQRRMRPCRTSRAAWSTVA